MLNNYLSRPVYQAKFNGTYQVYLVKANLAAGTAKVCQRIQHVKYELRENGLSSRFFGAIGKHKPGWTLRPYTVRLHVLFETRKEAQVARKNASEIFHWDDKARCYGANVVTVTPEELV